jgi:hypothetical protein
MKYKVYAKQKMVFTELEIEASSQEEAIGKYNALWNKGGQIYNPSCHL